MKLTQNGVLSFVVDSNLSGAVQCSVKNATSVQGTTRVRLAKARNVVNKRRMVFTDVNPKESVLGCSLLDSHNKGRGLWAVLTVVIASRVIRKLPEPFSFFSPLLTIGYVIILLLVVILCTIVCSLKWGMGCWVRCRRSNNDAQSDTEMASLIDRHNDTVVVMGRSLCVLRNE